MQDELLLGAALLIRMVFIMVITFQLIYRPILAIMFFLFCLKWGDWKNWRKYYPTMLYTVVWDLLNNFFTVNYPLWRLDHPILKQTFSELIIAFVYYPSSILLYLPYVPRESIVKQILQIAFWTLLFSLLEGIAITTHNISYYNGWNFWWSVGFNVIAFSMIRLHYENPLLAWPISVLLFLIFMIIFKLPLSSLL
jgi:hypothetical protein